jgi:hypothetical protein
MLCHAMVPLVLRLELSLLLLVVVVAATRMPIALRASGLLLLRERISGCGTDVRLVVLVAHAADQLAEQLPVT